MVEVTLSHNANAQKLRQVISCGTRPRHPPRRSTSRDMETWSRPANKSTPTRNGIQPDEQQSFSVCALLGTKRGTSVS